MVRKKDAPKKCEGCGAPHDGTANGSMPYSWGSGPIRWLCAACSPAAWARYEASVAAEGLSHAAREQKLVDVLFQCVLTVTDPTHAKAFAKKTSEERAAWVAAQLRACGFDTKPVGASWGVLKRAP